MDINLECFFNYIEAELNDFEKYVEENNGASKKDILVFLNDLRISVKETKEDM